MTKLALVCTRSESPAALGVRPGSTAHAPLLAHGVRLIYRLEQALPPETSLRQVLDQVLRQRLAVTLPQAGSSPVARPAAA